MGPLEISIRAHLTRYGYGRTYQLASRAGMRTADMRRRMLELERRGVVRRDERSSAVNDICWVLAPRAPTEPASRDASVLAGGSEQQNPTPGEVEPTPEEKDAGR